MTCQDCRTRKVYFLGLALILTITLTFLSIFYYIEKASSIESYNNLTKDCNSKIAQANRELAKCGSQPTSQAQERYFFPIMDNMNCSYGVDNQ